MPRGSSSSGSGDAAAAGAGSGSGGRDDDNLTQQQQQQQPEQPAAEPSTSAGGGGDDDGGGNDGRGRGGGGGGGGGHNNNDDNEDSDYEDEDDDPAPEPQPPASAAAAATGGVFGALFGGRAPTGAGGGGGGAAGSGGSTAALTLRTYGPGHTFVLAGFLKILTIGSVAAGAPAGAYRTAAGEISPYLLVPVSLGLCAAAKWAVDTRAVDEPGFLPGLAAVLALVYFGLTPLLYRYDGDYSDLRRRVLSPRPRGHGRLRDGARPTGTLGEAMVGAGARDLLATAAATPGGAAGGAWGRRTSRAVGQVHDADEYYRSGRYVTVEQKRREEQAREEQGGRR